jgi:hypothetical protein
VAALRGVVADGTRLAAAAARRAELESRTPVGYSLTPAAEAALTAPGDDPAGPRRP